jgi:hypothetical protein
MRDFALDLVQLPLMDVPGAMRLGSCLVAAGKQRSLPGLIARAHDRLETASEEMSQVFMAHLQEMPVSSQIWRERDRALDSAWAAIYYLLVAWSSLPGDRREAAQARELSQKLFPEGLKFTLLPYRLEWAESQRRVEMMQRDGQGAQIVALGGESFLSALLTAHEQYGQVLGMSPVVTPDRAEVKTLRDPFWTLVNAIRSYVLKVSAHVSEDDPASQGLAETLLLPIVEWSAEHPQAHAAGGGEGAVTSDQDIVWISGGKALPELDVEPHD